MTDKLQQTIKEEIRKLPKEMQDGIAAVNWIRISEEIGKKYLLNEADINNFQVETLLVLTGLTDPVFYAVNIENPSDTTKADAESMANEAFEKIFTPIKNIIEENIKKNVASQRIKPDQNINFILSGGDYSIFLPKEEIEAPSLIEKKKIPDTNPKTQIYQELQILKVNSPFSHKVYKVIKFVK